MAKLPPNPMTDRQRILRLWREYIWPQKWRFLLALFFMAMFAAATAALMYVFKLLVDATGRLGDVGAAEATQSYAMIILPVLLGVAFLTGISDFFQRILSNSLALNTVAKMQKQMLRATHHADFALFAREQTGNLISKFTFDVKVISDALIRVLSNLIKDTLTVIFTVGSMLYFNWQLTLGIAIFLLALWPIVELSKRLRGSAAEVQAHTGKLTSHLKESFSGAQLIKTYGLEGHEDVRIGREFDERIRLFMKLVTQQAWVEPILTLVGGLAIAGIFIFGFWQVNNDHATPGSVVAVLTGVFILSPRLRALGTLNNVIQEGLAALTRIFDMIDQDAAITNAPDVKPAGHLSGAVEFKDVSFTYEDGTTALEVVNLSAAKGETIALVGPSGGGKSTIINLIPRLYDATSGRVTIDGEDIRAFTLDSLRANIALVSQDVTLFNASIADNIGLGKLNATPDEIKAAAKAADAADFISMLPNGYDTILGEDGAGLSGGQKQRLSIARAILRDAPILLLDEATSALDAESESKVQAALDRLAQGRTTIVVAHRLSTVQKADRIYVLENGRVVETGTHATLSKKRGGIYKKLKELQS
ncbi:ABC transporter ATP-binding protein [Litorimonas sp. RW-G-Af-16]|uniref:ABC transporter ATP-binding protein n=1 Tax=Litorimonas sp. RW-G-Af-16 TaxID=3241168 RepID=UPI00390C6816